MLDRKTLFNRICRINAKSYPFTHAFLGCVSRWFGRALAWHARGHRFDPGILHQKALYFVGSMVLFFLLKPIFGGCIASPAPFSGFCRWFLYNPQLLTLHRFQKECLPPGFSAGCCIIPLNRRSKRRWSPTIREAAAFVDYRMSQL